MSEWILYPLHNCRGTEQPFQYHQRQRVDRVNSERFMDIKKVIVYGAGVMGPQIAQVAAMSGYEVNIVAYRDPYMGRSIKSIAKSLNKFVEKQKMTQDEVDEILGRITTTTDNIYDGDIVIEAIIENKDIKKDLFVELDQNCAPDVILASNTSSIPITDLAAATNRPGKVVGMHFMNPVVLMKCVELIRGEKTSDETFKTVYDLSEKMGKTPGVSNDFAGFIANRILMPYINEGVWALSQGVSDPKNIDLIAKTCLNMPMGPLELADLIGIDVCCLIMGVMHERFGDEKYRPCGTLLEMKEQGNLGRKSGKGFYDYSSK